MGHVAEIATRVIFQNFCYKFGGKTFQQQAGGPIGARVTMCAARMVMASWARDYGMILFKAGLKVPLLTGYVDDGRQGGTTLRKGMAFDVESKQFAWSKEQHEIDLEENLPNNIRMARRCLPAMNSINKSINY